MARRLILSYFTVHLRLLTQLIPPALPLENIPKSLIFECFQGVCKETIDMKWVKENPANIYLLKVNERNTRKRSEICSNLAIKTPE